MILKKTMWDKNRHTGNVSLTYGEIRDISQGHIEEIDVYDPEGCYLTTIEDPRCRMYHVRPFDDFVLMSYANTKFDRIEL